MARPAAGRLRKYLLVQKIVSTTRNAAGETAPVWGKHCNCWGEIKPLSGRELYQARAVESDVTHAITVRGSSLTRTITPDMQVVFQRRTFNLRSPPRDIEERHGEVILDAVEQIGVAA